MKNWQVLLLASVFLVGCGDDDDSTDKKNADLKTQAKSTLNGRVIYGEDNRMDLYEVENPNVLQLADATVALINKNDIEVTGGYSRIRSTPFATSMRMPLCAEERFREQNVAAFCSGFLVGRNIVVTAGHCVSTQGTPSSDCSNTKFVFGFSLNSAQDNPDIVPSAEVYGCKRIIKAQVENQGADFSVIELDRDVLNHTPLRLRRAGEPKTGDELLVLGHPSGLPLKVAGGATVRSVNSKFLRANLDTYGGNSGSAVINASSGEVEAILVRGEQDFEVKNNCLASKVCENTGCRGEDATRASTFQAHVPVE